MDKRREARLKKRIACSLTINGVRQHGIVMDLSSKGLFVQTSAKPKPGEPEKKAGQAPAADEPPPALIHPPGAPRLVTPRAVPAPPVLEEDEELAEEIEEEPRSGQS